MKFTQTQTTKTTLGPQIAIGEFEGHITHAKPGNYLVYNVKRESGTDEIALLFVHEDEIRVTIQNEGSHKLNDLFKPEK